MTSNQSFRLWMAILLLATLSLAVPAACRADGGPILSDPELWAQIEEGQQTAVVRLGGHNEVQVDLFISMLDRTGEPHEIVFFLPLGSKAYGFHVSEKTSVQFDVELTRALDATLLTEAEQSISYKRNLRWALMLGTTLINGAWTWPFWLTWSLAGCAPATTIAPLATFETDSSEVAIYGTDEDTDPRALIETAGLEPSVQETLARFKGQQIAVVRMQTQPRAGGTSRGEPTGQPGIHLSWSTEMIPHAAEAEATYAYPLGTGSAWAHPIELTRVYVAASPDADFHVQYPELGVDRSGFTVPIFGQSRPNILDSDGAAYAVENAVGASGRIWRATYMHSNSSEDVVITRLAGMSQETLLALSRPRERWQWQLVTYAASAIAAVVAWLVCWRFLMQRLLGLAYRWREIRLYQHALGWALVYPLTNGVLAGLTVALVPLTAGIALVLGIPILSVTLLGVVSAFLFARWSSRTLGVPSRRAVWAYLLVAFGANILYLAFAAAYAACLGVA